MTGQRMAAHRFVDGQIAAGRLRATRDLGRRWWCGCRTCGLGVSRLTAAGNGEQKQVRDGPACGPSPARGLPGRLADHFKIMTGNLTLLKIADPLLVLWDSGIRGVRRFVRTP